jgi:hypothetical protein
MIAQHLQALPAPILYNTSKGYCVIEEGFSLYGFRIFRIHRANGDFSVYYPQIFDASAPDRRAHIYANVYNNNKYYNIYSPNKITAAK